MYTALIPDTPLGQITANFNEHSLCEIKIASECEHVQNKNDRLAKQLSNELSLYFIDHQYQFSLPVDIQGTPFQKRVWQALRNIPAGKTLTYGQLADKLNSSPRAIGNACRANPVPIIIPCHRVIGKNGLGGYDGQTSGRRLAIKKWLLNHEGINTI